MLFPILRATDLAGNSTDRAITVTLEDVDEVAPEITGPAATGVRENITTVGTYTANEPVTWSISGGVDAARFVVTDGVLSFATPPDFEAPGDADGDNVYLVVLRATDVAGNSTDRAITVRLEDVDEVAPEITGPAAPSVRENITTVGTYTANEPVTWSISGGADAARFVVTDGVLSFAVAPDFEAPADADGNNVYLVVLRATDIAGNRAERAITVTVGDADEVVPEIAGSATPSVRENSTIVATYTANEPVTWSISGGVDAARFVVTDGVLSFAIPPDFEADRKSTRLNSSHVSESRMPSSA